MTLLQDHYPAPSIKRWRRQVAQRLILPSHSRDCLALSVMPRSSLHWWREPQQCALEATPAHGLKLLQRGLNTRLRELAARYDARVIDTYLPFRLTPDALIAGDCVHPNDLGHATIFELAKMAAGL